MKYFWTILLLLLVVDTGMAQELDLSNLRSKSIETNTDSSFVDSLLVFPASIKVLDPVTKVTLDSSFYQFRGQWLIWHSAPTSLPKTVLIQYRVLPYDLREVVQRIQKDSLINAASQEVIGFEYNPFADNFELIDFRGLNYNGSFARGIAFGNNQDLVLNSSFNLQLAGKLGNDVEIIAAITDENIPLQPEGNTQQLQEFDKIYIQLKREETQLIAGDYEITRPESYFMNYYKKLEGATVKHQMPVTDNQTLDLGASIAISRGKFARNQVIQQEGNQGPYKLQGNEGERFIIVQSGTEKVWVDGNLKRRGIEEDYVIDYNRGEVTFTNQVLITKDSRIIIEFEYSDLNFNRTLYTLHSNYTTPKVKLNFNLYSEQDSKNATGDQGLSFAQKEALSLAGDNFMGAQASSIDTLVDLNNFRVAYTLTDTFTTCGLVDSILIFNPNPDAATHTARFTFVGQGNGNYILDPQAQANERVYRWITPDSLTCTPRGDYEPIIQIIAPQQRRLMTFGMNYSPSQNTEIISEFSLSQNDLNRFSDLDSQDDQGIAIYSAINQQFNLSKKNEDWKVNTGLKYEFTDRNFQALNPYRDPEFSRDWNLVNIQGLGTIERAQEQIIRGNIGIQKKGLGQLSYTLSNFNRENIYQGIKHSAQFGLQQSGWAIFLKQDLLTTDEAFQQTRFSRPQFKLAKQFKQGQGWTLGIQGEREKSARYQNQSDTLTTTSFHYDKYRFFLESAPDKPYSFQLNYANRIDFRPVETTFQRSAEASEFNVNGSWRQKNWLQLKSNLTYRTLEVNDLDQSGNNSGSTFLGRTDLGIILAKGAVRINNVYEIGSGQEPKAEFSYVRVAQGEGTHIWLDSLFNNDGIVQPNEMEIAPFQDRADFVRITTFTNDFIRTDNVSLNQNLLINPKAVWFGSKGIKKALSRFSTQSTFKINRKTQEGASVSSWNPFDLAIKDTALVSVAASIRNLVFFNRGNPAFDFQVGHSDNRNKFVQTTGFESQQRSSYFFKTRINLTKALSAQFNTTLENRLTDSEFFNNKDYEIETLSFNPQLEYLISQSLRFSLKYTYEQNKNILAAGNGESAVQHDFNLETTINRSTKSALRSRISLVQIAFEGAANSPVGFAILNGLQDGRNFLWNITLDRQISQNIRLNLSYDGRKTGTNQVVHVGRVQIAAVF